MNSIICGSFERGTTPSCVMKFGLSRPIAPNARLRSADEPEQNARDDAKHPFAADARAAQVVAFDIFACARTRAEPGDFPIGQHHLESERMVRRHSIFESVRPA